MSDPLEGCCDEDRATAEAAAQRSEPTHALRDMALMYARDMALMYARGYKEGQRSVNRWAWFLAGWVLGAVFTRLAWAWAGGPWP